MYLPLASKAPDIRPYIRPWAKRRRDYYETPPTPGIDYGQYADIPEAPPLSELMGRPRLAPGLTPFDIQGGAIMPPQPEREELFGSMLNRAKEEAAMERESQRIETKIKEIQQDNKLRKVLAERAKLEAEAARPETERRQAEESRQRVQTGVGGLIRKARYPSPRQALGWTRRSPEYQDYLSWGGTQDELMEMRRRAATEQVRAEAGGGREVAPGVTELFTEMRTPMQEHERGIALGQVRAKREEFIRDLEARRLADLAQREEYERSMRPPAPWEIEMAKAQIRAPQFDYRKTREAFEAEQYPAEYRTDLTKAIEAIREGADAEAVFQRIAARYPEYSAELKRILMAGAPSELDKLIKLWAEKEQ